MPHEARQLNHVHGPGMRVDAPMPFPASMCSSAAADFGYGNTSTTSQQLVELPSSTMEKTLIPEESLVSFVNESFSPFPATPIAEDFFSNLPRSTSPNASAINIEFPATGCVPKRSNDLVSTVCSSAPSSNCQIQVLAENSNGHSCTTNKSEFFNAHGGMYSIANFDNHIKYAPVVLESNSVDVIYENQICLKSLRSSPYPLNGTSNTYFSGTHFSDNSNLRVLSHTNSKARSDTPADLVPINSSTSIRVINSSDHQPTSTASSQPATPNEKSCHFKDDKLEHNTTAVSYGAPSNNDAEITNRSSGDTTKDVEVGVLPPELCLFEVVSMLKCARCDAVFPDTASLILHYQKSHLAGASVSPVRIKVSTASSTLCQKNKPVVVCHKCGSTVPPSVLEWYTSKVRGKVPGHRKKLQPTAKSTCVKTQPPPPSQQEMSETMDDIHTAPDVRTTATCNSEFCLSSACSSPQSCDGASEVDDAALHHPQRESLSPPAELEVTSPPAVVESHCSDDCFDLSEEESIMDEGSDSNKKENTGDNTTQVYILDVLGGTPQHKSAQATGADDGVQRKRTLRPPLKFSDGEAPPLTVQTPPKINKCRTQGCRLRFSSPELRDLHESCHRLGGKAAFNEPFICPFCSYTMKKWYAIQRHLWQVHQRDVDMLQCGVCHTFRAHNEHSLSVHQKTHSDLKPYPCQMCDQQFRQLSQLLNHTRTHEPEKEVKQQKQEAAAVQCSQCCKSLINKKQLSRHIKSVHEKARTHRCPTCPYATNRIADLRNHQRRHAKERLYECCVCEMKFRDQTSQRRHLLRHLPLSLLQCPLCSFHTSRPQHFSSHFTSQHQQQQQALNFECKLCGERSSTVSQYCSHSRTHHSDLLQQLVAQHPPVSKKS